MVCVLALMVYSRSLWNGFVRDDHLQIENNPQIQSWDRLPEILTSHLWSHAGTRDVLFYRPLFSVWMLVIHTLGGLSPWFWHLSSIALHAGCTYLVYLLAKHSIESEIVGNEVAGSEIGAVVAAAIFAVHPSHVDAVGWVSASNELLFTLLMVAALIVIVPPSGKASPQRVALSALLFLTGMFAKETGIALLILLIVVAWVSLGSSLSRRTRSALAAGPYLFAAGLWLAVRWFALGGTGIEYGEHTWREVFFTAPSIILFYLRKLFLPAGLSGGYVNPLYSSPTSGFWLPLLALLVMIVAAVWMAIRRNWLVGCSLALILLPLAPAAVATRLYPQGDMTHDRYLYLPSVGLCLLAGYLASYLWTRSRRAAVVTAGTAVGLIIAFSVLTFSQQRFYRDDVAFLDREIEVNPQNAFAYALLGNVEMDESRPDLGVDHYRIAAQLAPDDPKINLFLARGLFAQKHYNEAEAVLNRLAARKDFDNNRQNAIRLSLANVEMSMGKMDRAGELLQQVAHSDPRFPELHWALGVLYQKENRLAEAQHEYEQEYQSTGDEEAHRQSMLLSKQILSHGSSGGAQY